MEGMKLNKMVFVKIIAADSIGLSFHELSNG